MKVELNHWYLFKTDADRNNFCQTVYKQYGYRPVYPGTPDCLRITNHLDNYDTNFRTTYREEYMRGIKVWVAQISTATKGEIGLVNMGIPSSYFDTDLTQDVKMTQELFNANYMGIPPTEKGDIMQIIETYRKKQMALIKSVANAKRDEIIKNNKLYARIAEINKEVKTYNESLEEDATAIQIITRPEFMLNKEERAEISKIEDERDTKLKALDDKLIELKELLEIADNFEQKRELLIKYDIIGG